MAGCSSMGRGSSHSNRMRNQEKGAIGMELVWDGLFFSPSGYAEAARSYVQALTRAGVKVRVTPRDQPIPEMPLPPDMVELIHGLREQEVSPDAPIIQHSQPPYFRLGQGDERRLRIGYTVFETDQIPASWVWPCNAMSEIWVPCEQNRDSFARSGVREQNIHVIPHAIDTERFRPGLEGLSIADNRSFQFLSIFQWQWRKGWDLLLGAYLEAFGPDDDVSLIVKTGPEVEGYLEAAVKAAAEGSRTPRIVLDTSTLPLRLIPRLYASADCFVLPFRGEGFGLPIAEAMACGLPVITTRWGGPPDYVTEETGYLLDVREFVPPDPAYCQGTDADSRHRWAEPDGDQLVQIMRHVFEHREEARLKGARGREAVMARLSYAVIARKIQSRIEEMLGASAASS